MAVTRAGAVVHAVAVTFGAWTVGVLVTGLSSGEWVGSWWSGAPPAFPLAALVVALAARLARPGDSRLLTATVSVCAYELTLLLHTVIWAAGDGGAVDLGFVMLTLALLALLSLLTLQLPACFLLSLALSKPLLGLRQPVWA